MRPTPTVDGCRFVGLLMHTPTGVNVRWYLKPEVMGARPPPAESPLEVFSQYEDART